MFVTLNLTVPNAYGPHTVAYRGSKYPIGGDDQVIVRVADIRAATRVDEIRGGPYTLLITLDDQQYTVSETPAEIAALLAAAMPARRSMHDHAVMGGIDLRVSGGAEIAGAVEHVHIDRREMEAAS